MSSYNGELYIAQQIRSIMNQSYRPDELIKFDEVGYFESADAV